MISFLNVLFSRCTISQKIAIWLSKNCQKLDIFFKKIARNFLFFSKKIAIGQRVRCQGWPQMGKSPRFVRFGANLCPWMEACIFNLDKRLFWPSWFTSSHFVVFYIPQLRNYQAFSQWITSCLDVFVWFHFAVWLSIVAVPISLDLNGNVQVLYMYNQ